MRKILSVVLVCIMLISTFTPIYAESVKESIAGIGLEIANPLQMGPLGLAVMAKKHGDPDTAYVESMVVKDISLNETYDYKAELDMTSIRELFSGEFITLVLNGDTQALAEFDAAKVESDITVTITYSKNFDKADVTNSTVGQLYIGGTDEEHKNIDAYIEDGRTFNDTSDNYELIIKYKNKLNLTAGDLRKFTDDYLSNIFFVLKEVGFKNGEVGENKITVSMEGETTVGFASFSEPQKIKYNAERSYIIDTKAVHKLEVVPAVAPTCTKPGQDEGIICRTHDSYNCGSEYTKAPVTREKLDHKGAIKTERKEATCTAAGNIAYFTCPHCLKRFGVNGENVGDEVTNVVLPATGHTFGDPVTKIVKTCTVDGYTEKECSVCHYVLGVTDPATGHDFEETPAEAATCEADGSTKGKVCKECGEVVMQSVTIPMLGHDWGEWTVTQEPTETREGEKQRVCKNDPEHKETAKIAKKEHKCQNTREEKVDSTCAIEGSVKLICTDCGALVSETVIPKKPHSGTHVAAEAATCTKRGTVEHWKCSECGGLFADAACTKSITNPLTDIDKNNHTNIEKVPAVPATCTNIGLGEGQVCKDCKLVINPQGIIKMLAHDFQHIERQEHCNLPGTVEHYKCTLCEKLFAQDQKTEISLGDTVLAPQGHDYEYQSSEDANHDITTKVSCKRYETHTNECCGFAPQESTKKHDHNEYNETKTIIKPATCYQTGTKTVAYLCCGEKLSEDIIPITHNLKKVSAKPSTCYEKGYNEYWYCADCGKKFLDDAGRTEIVKIPETELSTEHRYQDKADETDKGYTYSVKECSVCKHRVRTRKNHKIVIDNEGHKQDVQINTNPSGTGSGYIRDKDDVLEDNQKKEAIMESRKEVLVVRDDARTEERAVSDVLNEKIREDNTLTDASGKKLEPKAEYGFEAEVEKVSTIYQEASEGEPDFSQKITETREPIHETNHLIEIIIPIPYELQGCIGFAVHRLHEGILEIISTVENVYGEKIIIDTTNNKVKLYVKRFSEYALVGYEDAVTTPVVQQTPSGGGSMSSGYNVKLDSNGGTAVGNVTVRSDGTIAEPKAPERTGYKFMGWYTDLTYTTLFDFSQKITENITLYAKWEKISDDIFASDCPGTPESDCPLYNFNDLDGSMWYHPGVCYVLRNGIMFGTSDETFEPDSPLTRAMLVAMLWRTENNPDAPESNFTDLVEGEYYVPAVAWAEANGIVSGYDETTFAPYDNILREQIVAIMYRYAKYKGYDVSADKDTDITSYSDLAKVSEYAIPAMKYAVGTKLLTGRTESTLEPKENATRAEMATILFRFLMAN